MSVSGTPLARSFHEISHTQVCGIRTELVKFTFQKIRSVQPNMEEEKRKITCRYKEHILSVYYDKVYFAIT